MTANAHPAGSAVSTGPGSPAAPTTAANQQAPGCPVVITIDVDGDLPFLNQSAENAQRLKSRSVGTYGPTVGVRRLLATLDAVRVQATWFLPGAIAQAHPDLVGEIGAAGHELAVHGHRHLDFSELDLRAQLAEMNDGSAALHRVAAEAGVASAVTSGFRVPAGEWAPGFLPAMAAAGFTWSSSLPADEVPFTLGASGITELPTRFELEDMQYMGYNLDPPFPPGQSRIASHRTVRQNWQTEYLGAERFSTLYLLRLNAEVMGTPGRAELLAGLLAWIRDRGTARFATASQLDAAYRSTTPDPTHPFTLFERLAAQEGRS